MGSPGSTTQCGTIRRSDSHGCKRRSEEFLGLDFRALMMKLMRPEVQREATGGQA